MAKSKLKSKMGTEALFTNGSTTVAGSGSGSKLVGFNNFTRVNPMSDKGSTTSSSGAPTHQHRPLILLATRHADGPQIRSIHRKRNHASYLLRSGQLNASIPSATPITAPSPPPTASSLDPSPLKSKTPRSPSSSAYLEHNEGNNGGGGGVDYDKIKCGGGVNYEVEKYEMWEGGYNQEREKRVEGKARCH
ncbi:hypothetical protein OSB04_009795 [Centaurea solstitialis]|uniref:Uncharacterized protein n=1 Tax=Centaurea solstitialis TaxID=347529 RepID=A0AA38TJI1_9ASTR|nr:hypothetical protein OSB04_009795 [Centaurea solstitialis]